jgi:uncharacterized oxidoreductase
VGAVAELKEKLKPFKFPVILTGVKSWNVFCKHLGHTPDLPVYHYKGEACYGHATDLAPEFKKEGADLIVAIGGGKLIDTAKLMADTMSMEFATVPTLISNCAGYTPITAVYKPNHEFRFVDYHKRSPYFTLVDYEMLLDAPKEYFVAGIGDTLAKWYEADAICRAAKNIPTFASLGLACSKVVYETLMRCSKGGMKALDEHKVNDDFKAVADTIIGLAGTVGGFGGTYCRMAGAHSFNNGLSLAHEMEQVQHGMKVGYGILVQLAAVGDTDEIKRLIPVYKSVGLPVTLKELGLVDTPDGTVEEKLQKVCAFAAKPEEQFNLVKADITADDVRKAVDVVEKLTNA